MSSVLIGVAALILLGFTQREAIAAQVLTRNGEFDRWDDFFRRAAARHGIPDWRWLKAIAWNESSVGTHPTVRHGLEHPTDVAGSASMDKLSWGIMQMTLPTANDMRRGTTVPELNNPDISIDLGAKYVAWLYRRYSGDLRKTVMGYNQGPGNTDNGKEYAAGYYDRFTKHLAVISGRQPA